MKTSEWARFIGHLRDPQTYEILGLHAAKIALIFLAAWLVSAVGRVLVNRATRPLIQSEVRRNNLSAAARRRTLAALLHSLIRYSVYFCALIAIVSTWNVHVLGVLGTALGTAGVLGIVVGFGAQKLVRDVITGIFMLMEDQYSVGDTVTIGTVTGVVEDIGIRITRIRDEIGRLTIIPNGDISQVTNHSRGRLDAAVEISVPLDGDLDAVRGAIAAASELVMKPDDSPIAAPAALTGITAMDGTKMTLRIVVSAKGGRLKPAEMALRKALREEFLARDIKLV